MVGTRKGAAGRAERRAGRWGGTLVVEAGLGCDRAEVVEVVLILLQAMVLWVERKERSWRRFFSSRS